MIMKSKAMTWAWILMLIQGFVMLIPCTFGFFYPEWSAGIVVKTIAGMSVAEVSSMYPELWQVIKLGFRGIGFAMIGSNLMALFIIIIPFRKGEKGAWFLLLILGLFYWITNVPLEASINIL